MHLSLVHPNCIASVVIVLRFDKLIQKSKNVKQDDFDITEEGKVNYTLHEQ